MSWQSKPCLGLVALVACATNPILVRPGGDGDYASTIPDAATWTALAAREGSQSLARVETVKVILDRDAGALYFTQSRRWPIHYDFASRFLGAGYDHRAFNDHEYHAPDRRFVLGSVTHYLDQDAWTFELFAGDSLDVPSTIATFDKVRAAVFVGPKLRYRPVPQEQQHQLDQLRARIPVITTEELFANLRYQPLEIGEAWGNLRVIPAGHELPADLRPFDIVVLGTQPIEIPVVAGIVTDEIQAPLGHIAVLAHSRGTPNMASRDATTQFAALDGKPVHLVVGTNDFHLEAATPDELAKAAKARRGRSPAIRLSLDDRGLPALADIDPDDVAHFGAKTTQLARVARIGGVHTPRAFGLPFHAYAAFLASAGVDKMIASMLTDPGLRRDSAKWRTALDLVRERLLAAPVPPEITRPIAARIQQVLPGSKRVRLRSSTNAEDLDGFSGAGLYHSAKIDPSKPGDLERGLRDVWASVWTYDAYLEREWYGIDHARVAMAILVQESIDDDVVNGVAITGNPFFQGRPAVYINAQVRGGSVTGAAGNEIPEQLLYYTYETGQSLERISDSSRARGTHLVSDDEAKALATNLEDIHRAFVDEPVGSEAATDVEWLIRANRQIVIVQARPYKMSWAGDRKAP
jgi:hypothetical protein